jgi:hypothetical protein
MVGFSPTGAVALEVEGEGAVEGRAIVRLSVSGYFAATMAR